MTSRPDAVATTRRALVAAGLDHPGIDVSWSETHVLVYVSPAGTRIFSPASRRIPRVVPPGVPTVETVAAALPGAAILGPGIVKIPLPAPILRRPFTSSVKPPILRLDKEGTIHR